MRLPRSLPGRYDRATFLTQSALVLLGATSAGAAPSPPWKGRKSSRVTRWDVITVGNLARNRYWGESEAKPLRSTLCTCTVVQGEGFRLIVDPSEGNADDMARELDRHNIHLVSVLPNAGAHHEFKGLNTRVRFECKTSPLKVVGGKIKVPTGPGLGVDIDPEFVRKHQPVTA